jgi:cytochrome c553
MTTLNKIFVGVLLGLGSFFIQAQENPQFAAGEKLFRTAGGYGCSTCHGMFAQGGGNVGGNIRGKTLEDINARLNNEPTMKLLADALTTNDRQLLAFYLEALGELQLVEWTIEDKPMESTLAIEAGKQSQLVIFNKRLEPVSFVLPASASHTPVVVNPYETRAYDWTPEPGTAQLIHKQNTLTIQIQ